MKRSILSILVTLAAAAALGVIAPMAAASGETALCKTEEEPCSEANRVTSLHLALTSGSVLKLLNSTADVLCLTALLTAEVLEPGTPQALHAKELNISGCGTDANHNNCTVTTLELPEADLLRSDAGNYGLLTILSGGTRIKCVIFGFIKIDCTYDYTGLEFEFEGALNLGSETGGGMLPANEHPASLTEGSGLCPEESSFDFLLEPLKHVYLGKQEHTALCKTHSSETCAEKDLVKEVHMVSTEPPVLLNTVANVECEESLLFGVVGSLTANPDPQTIEPESPSWTGCHTQGAADNCTVTSGVELLALHRTALNIGAVTATGVTVAVKCDVFDLFELDCAYGGTVELEAEGALHREGTGNGMFTADKEVLKKTEGEGHCPESVKWSALYEPLEHVYIVE